MQVGVQGNGAAETSVLPTTSQVRRCSAHEGRLHVGGSQSRWALFPLRQPRHVRARPTIARSPRRSAYRLPRRPLLTAHELMHPAGRRHDSGGFGPRPQRGARVARQAADWSTWPAPRRPSSAHNGRKKRAPAQWVKRGGQKMISTANSHALHYLVCDGADRSPTGTAARTDSE